MGALALLGGALLAGSFLAQASGDGQENQAALAQVPDLGVDAGFRVDARGKFGPGRHGARERPSRPGPETMLRPGSSASSNRWTTIAGEP